MNSRAFQKTVLGFYAKEGRHDLPWRKTKDAYKILVSEVMLQQTQVERVRGFYKNFLEQFPTIEALAKAPLGDVLRAWQGLGYNRRAKMLHEAAKQVVRDYKGKLPKTAEQLEQLPGNGHYTARAVAAFAANADSIFLETNIRTVLLHHFFQGKESVHDSELIEVLAQVTPEGNAREWYWALMDYGSYLKRTGIRNNAKSRQYTKQSTFSGSSREARGAILKALAKKPQTKHSLRGILGDDRRDQIAEQLTRLEQERLVEKQGRLYQLPR